MRRRIFIRRMLGTVAAAGLARLSAAESSASGSPAFRATDPVRLGPRHIPATRLFLGTGSSGWRGSSNQTRKLGLDGLANYLRDAFRSGITSWDSADQYGSHPHLAKALQLGIPRDKITILTKSRAATPAAMRADIARFQRELGTDVIDILLLHCLEDPKWPASMRGVMDVVSEYQEKGIIRSKGVSCHSIGALEAAAAEPWVEIDLARINPRGAVMDAPPETVVPVLRAMKHAGKGVIGMKIFGAGRLLGEKQECLNYVLNLGCVDAFTIGCENSAQLAEVVSLIAAAPRTAKG